MVENKVVIVTGGAWGIGKETSILVAKEGAKIAHNRCAGYRWRETGDRNY